MTIRKLIPTFLQNNENLNEIDLHNKLLTLTNLNFIDAASKIAKQILKTNRLNQEAWMVYLVSSKLKNSPEAFNELNLTKTERRNTSC